MKKNSNENNKFKKKFLVNCIYSVGSASQTSDYEIITEFLINHIKKNYKWGGDIAFANDDTRVRESSADLLIEAEQKGIILGKGYGEWKNSTFRIANFPALDQTEIESLQKFLESLCM